jgi:2-amino-4-hydroxy-6-hydroxymethyldihydropteridine diphosphokinase
MSAPKPGYLIGLGSNIQPHHNMTAMVNALSQVVDTLTLSRVIEIPPVGMNTDALFLNAVAFAETALPVTALKAHCNRIEQALGRDRTDPDRKHKDRPADLDILVSLTDLAAWQSANHTMTDEYFLYPLIDELRAFITETAFAGNLPTGVALHADDLTFGQAPTTIHRQ